MKWQYLREFIRSGGSTSTSTVPSKPHSSIDPLPLALVREGRCVRDPEGWVHTPH